jgi:hypothetical protein
MSSVLEILSDQELVRRKVFLLKEINNIENEQAKREKKVESQSMPIKVKIKIKSKIK